MHPPTDDYHVYYEKLHTTAMQQREKGIMASVSMHDGTARNGLFFANKILS